MAVHVSTHTGTTRIQQDVKTIQHATTTGEIYQAEDTTCNKKPLIGNI
jgi:hypothetical protein